MLFKNLIMVIQVNCEAGVIIGGDSLPQLKLESFCYNALNNDDKTIVKLAVRVGNDSCILINNRVIKLLSRIGINGKEVCLFITSRKLFDCLSGCLNSDKCRSTFLSATGLANVNIRMCTKQSFLNSENKKRGFFEKIKRVFKF